MKRILIAALALLTWLTPQVNASDILFEGKVGYFHPTGGTLNNIYGGGGIYGGELTVPVCDGIAAWAGASYFSQHGHSLGLRNSTRVQLVPVTFGLKYFIPFDCYDVYIGAGMERVYLWTHDHSDFVRKHTRKSGLGGVFKLGAIVFVCPEVFFDFFFDYSLCRIHFHDKIDGTVYPAKADVSGMSVGIGVGYRFGCGY